MRRLIAALITAFMLAGCSAAGQARPRPVSFDLAAPVVNLDPQFAHEPAAKMIIQNVFEGLCTRGENGSAQPGVAQSWETADDGKTITFRLRPDARWLDGESVTADDFVFAFRRLFARGAASPYAKDYIAIQNAGAVLAGEMPAASLGVRANGPGELIIRLSHPSPFFPDLLAEPAAMPCNESFFLNSRGRYGLDREFVNSNGPLYVDRWDDKNAVRLRPNENYASELPANTGGVNLNITEESPADRILDGESDAAFLQFEDVQRLDSEYSATSFESTVWCVIFNQRSPVWGNPLLRQGLARAVDREMLCPSLPEKLVLTELFLPPTATLASLSLKHGQPLGFDPEQAGRLYGMGLDAMPNGQLTDTTMYAPSSAEHQLAAGMVQQSWQKHLNAFLNVTPQTPEQLDERFESGNFGIMIMPFTLQTPRAEVMLRAFASDLGENEFGYANALYDLKLEELAAASGADEALALSEQAETMLLQDAAVIPLYYESAVFVTAPDITGAVPVPCLSRLSFKYLAK